MSATSHVIHASIGKRPELSSDIGTTRITLIKMVVDLEHLDRALLMFDPEYRIDGITPKPSGHLIVKGYDRVLIGLGDQTFCVTVFHAAN